MTAASAVTLSAEVSSTAQPHSVCGGELCCAITVDNSGASVLFERHCVRMS